jgi:hypothetical protein
MFNNVIIKSLTINILILLTIVHCKTTTYEKKNTLKSISLPIDVLQIQISLKYF